MKIKRWLKIFGPGLIVMLADTDAGCLITAAQSGAQYGYSMILPQIILIPILYMAQEMTVRLGIVTKKGHGELIREHFGKKWAYLSAVTLFISVIGALITEFIGIAGVGELFGISKWITVPFAIILLSLIGLNGSYKKVEHIGIAVGLFELVFIIGLFFVHPSSSQIINGFIKLPINDPNYIYLIAANVGAVIMPWMIFYQQGAVIDKQLKPNMIKEEKYDTAIGTIITQAIMIGYIILFAAIVANKNNIIKLNSVADLASELGNFSGINTAKIIIGLSIIGGAFVAAIVVALAGTWGITEVLNVPHSLNYKISRKNLYFYLIYVSVFLISGIMVLFMQNMIDITIFIEVLNALMTPIVLGFLLMLENKALPNKYKMHGFYKWLVIICCLIVMIFGIYMIGPTLNFW
ncbi:divalent metal cation transporter [Apilactobacillus micheneri]|uniref:Divalent metal cation transporter n=2 Tax=Apilactobacillus micheneri TaxID=1899430 RepID=A0ABY2YWG9_9LACO|nr:divalent metal cation transporter [Apilactobacillus micheneri]TPR25300.1 divalent metal cation transporter [Apilactobacillus micheneri]TPR27612.1 divalent metal cation transporter [Apilactobacillus micheneri]TPR28877.1 divalent metal cation transporter [Apilactobacillus micheneri]TPR29899.1 divalent metal cation transporter [Apilactobacillus micheneri]